MKSDSLGALVQVIKSGESVASRLAIAARSRPGTSGDGAGYGPDPPPAAGGLVGSIGLVGHLDFGEATRCCFVDGSDDTRHRPLPTATIAC